MNKEIKEILEMLRKYGSTNDKVLLDYITNLQQENERLNKGYCELKEKCNKGECDCSKEEYMTMAEQNMKLSLENERLKEEYVLLQNGSENK